AAYARQDIDDDHAECAGFCDRHRCAPPVKLGEKCKFDRMCGEGNHCAAGKCVTGAIAHRKDACSAGGCDEGLRCIHDACAEPKAAGAPCTLDAECLGACLKKPGKKGICGVGCAP